MMAAEDSQSKNPEKTKYQNSWFELQRARAGDDYLWKGVKEVREKLNAYFEMPQYCNTQRERLKLPRKNDTGVLRQWLTPKTDKPFSGTEGRLWETEHDNDFIAVCPEQSDSEADLITKYILKLLPWYHNKLGHRVKELPLFHLKLVAASLYCQKPILEDVESGQFWEH